MKPLASISSYVRQTTLIGSAAGLGLFFYWLTSGASGGLFLKILLVVLFLILAGSVSYLVSMLKRRSSRDKLVMMARGRVPEGYDPKDPATYGDPAPEPGRVERRRDDL